MTGPTGDTSPARVSARGLTLLSGTHRGAGGPERCWGLVLQRGGLERVLGVPCFQGLASSLSPFWLWAATGRLEPVTLKTKGRNDLLPLKQPGAKDRLTDWSQTAPRSLRGASLSGTDT